MLKEFNNIYEFDEKTFGKNIYKKYSNAGDIYIIQTDYINDDHYKIGVTNNIRKRMCNYRCGNTYEPRLHYYISCEDTKIIDNVLKTKLLKHNVKREIFKGNVEELKNIIAEVVKNEFNLSKVYIHEPDIKLGDLSECNHCNKCFYTKKDLFDHLNKCENYKEFLSKKTDGKFICEYCKKSFSRYDSLNRHLKNCQKNVDMVQLVIKEKNQEIESLKNKQEQEILILELEKEKALNKEKDLRLADQAKALEIAKNSKNITINNTTNKTINFLNNNFGEMIAMEQFLNALEHTHQLTIQERKDLLNAYYDCGIDVFARNFSYIMKENCKRQLESQGIKDMKLIPLFCSDGNLRSHKEKQTDGWKTFYDNQSINHMINISNQQIYDTYQKLVPVSGRERNRVFKEIKKNNHQNNFKEIKDNNNNMELDED